MLSTTAFVCERLYIFLVYKCCFRTCHPLTLEYRYMIGRKQWNTELQSQCLSPVAGTTNTHHHSWYCCVLFFIIIMCFIITLNQNLHVLITLKFIFFICKIVPLSLLKSQINMKKLQLLAKHHKKWEVISTHWVNMCIRNKNRHFQHFKEV